MDHKVELPLTDFTRHFPKGGRGFCLAIVMAAILVEASVFVMNLAME
jgi:hypothetical protein